MDINKGRLLLFRSFCGIISCNIGGDGISYPRAHNLVYHLPKPKSDSVLVTGWYYVSDTNTGYARKLLGETKKYYLNPKPILTANDIAFIRLENYGKQRSLVTTFFDDRKEALHKAIKKSIAKKFGFIIDDSLVYAPVVQSEIMGGSLALSVRNDTNGLLERFKVILGAEMPRAK